MNIAELHHGSDSVYLHKTSFFLSIENENYWLNFPKEVLAIRIWGDCNIDYESEYGLPKECDSIKIIATSELNAIHTSYKLNLMYSYEINHKKLNQPNPKYLSVSGSWNMEDRVFITSRKYKPNTVFDSQKDIIPISTNVSKSFDLGVNPELLEIIYNKRKAWELPIENLNWVKHINMELISENDGSLIIVISHSNTSLFFE